MITIARSVRLVRAPGRPGARRTGDERARGGPGGVEYPAPPHRRRRKAGHSVDAWRVSGLVALSLVLVACAAGGRDASTSLLTTPKPSRSAPPPPSSSPPPFGAPPVVAPAALRAVAATYYDAAGPAPQNDDGFRPACLLMLPTALQRAPLKPVPRARFNIFDEYEVTWPLAPGRGTGLALFVYPPGDPSDLEFFGPDAQVTTLPDGTDLRVTPRRPRATLIQVPTQNCEYELETHRSFPAAGLDPIVRSLRLVFAP
jgi:hypothetical protein